jgi:hypothetical protein
MVCAKLALPIIHAEDQNQQGQIIVSIKWKKLEKMI